MNFTQRDPKLRPQYKTEHAWFKANNLVVLDKKGGIAYWGNTLEPWYKRYFLFYKAKLLVWWKG